jgi:uncharacterized NAD-dependent epimerase/dehydratase family protein
MTSTLDSSTQLIPEKTQLSILCEGFTGTRHAKTATGVVKYGNWQVKSIIDSENVGKSFLELSKIDTRSNSSSDSNSNKVLNDIPIVKNLEDALQISKIDALLIGIAPVGGQIPETWIQIIKEAISKKIHIISGLHEFLNEIPELTSLAKENKILLWDVRNPDLYSSSAMQSVAKQKTRPGKLKIISMVGSDCNVGKMCTALEIVQEIKNHKKNAEFLATGQTGIMISGSGVPLDRVIGDFMAGSIENELHKIIQEKDPEFIVVEGQGSLLHPGYSGVTLSLIHGSNPDYLILCLKAGLKYIQGGYQVKIPSITELIKIYETASSWIQASPQSAKVIGISINTSELDEISASKLIEDIKTETKLPVTDPIRFGTKGICKRILEISNTTTEF